VPLLIIDAGTAITYDVVLPPGHFVGGNISPGLTTRFLHALLEITFHQKFYFNSFHHYLLLNI